MYAEVIVTGIIVSIAFTYFTSLSPAGLIVPGYIVLSLSSPYKILWTLIIAFATLGIYRLISRFTILYGQRRFALMVIISLLLSQLVTMLPVPAANIGVIGYLIPGILAKELDRQGVVRTLLSLLFVSGVTAMICLLLGVTLF